MKSAASLPSAAAVRRRVRPWLDRLGPQQSPRERRGAAQRYWTDPQAQDRAANAHLRGRDALDQDRWSRVGAEHLHLLQSLLPPDANRPPWLRVVEWGAGGGANAVQLAPLAKEFVAVDLAPDVLEACRREVAAVTATPLRTVLTSVEDPWAAAEAVGRASCDLFCCLYVLELMPDRASALELLRVARWLLTDDGIAFVQVKYSTGRWSTRSRRRSYERDLANMTTFAIHEFWEASASVGLEPHAVHLVPMNDLDERYAYFVLRKAPSGPAAVAGA